MPEGTDDLVGPKVARRVVRDRILDEASGHEFHTEESIETASTFDGSEEEVENRVRQLLGCGHVHQVGGYVARCDSCSKKAGNPVYVCGLCAVTCPVTGETLCRRCSKLGPDLRRYSPEGLQRAQDMGLFDHFQPQPPVGSPRGSLSRISSVFRRFLEWW